MTTAMMVCWSKQAGCKRLGCRDGIAADAIVVAVVAVDTDVFVVGTIGGGALASVDGRSLVDTGCAAAAAVATVLVTVVVVAAAADVVVVVVVVAAAAAATPGASTTWHHKFQDAAATVVAPAAVAAAHSCFHLEA